MLRILVIFSLMLVIISQEILSQSPGYNIPARKKKEVKEKTVFVPDYEIMFSFSNHTSSAFFDKKGNLKTLLPDSTTYPGIPLEYTFDLKRYTFDLEFSYFATEKLTLTAKAPLTIYTLDEIFKEYIDPETGVYPRSTRSELRHTRVDYIGLSADYALFDKAFINRYTIDIHIPTGSRDGVSGDNSAFWNDGAFEFSPGFVVGVSSDKATIEVGAKYNYRAEDMTDRVISNINFALHTVPGTRFYGIIEGALNVNMNGHDIIEDVFDIRKMPWQDEYLDAGFGFKFVVEDHYIGDFSYKVRLAGRNAWNHAAYFINFGLRF